MTPGTLAGKGSEGTPVEDGLRGGRHEPETRILPVGARAVVAVPASSANLGPGFDALGLAVDWSDEVSVELIEHGCIVEVTGEGAADIPRDERHLIIATAEAALRRWGVQAPGWRLSSHNTIPHGRGLGSSSAALVSGLLIAWSLAYPGRPLDPAALVHRAAQLEGHADNVAAAVLGGFVMTWMGTTAPAGDIDAGTTHAVRGRVHPDLVSVAFVPELFVATEAARAALPAVVPHRDAALNAGRAALFVHAIENDPDLLPEATRDWLHQDYRRDLMPESVELLEELRHAGIGSFISGAGPTVMALLKRDRLSELDGLRPLSGFVRHDLEIGQGARLISAEVPLVGQASRAG